MAESIDPIELSILQADIAGSQEHEFEILCQWAVAFGVPIVDSGGTILFTPPVLATSGDSSP